MARKKKRMISPEIMNDTDMTRLRNTHPHIRSLFEDLWMIADDAGNLPYDIELVKAECCPGIVDLTEEAIGEMIELLLQPKKKYQNGKSPVSHRCSPVHPGFLVEYHGRSGEKLLHIAKFAKHQSINFPCSNEYDLMPGQIHYYHKRRKSKRENWKTFRMYDDTIIDRKATDPEWESRDNEQFITGESPMLPGVSPDSPEGAPATSSREERRGEERRGVQRGGDSGAAATVAASPLGGGIGDLPNQRGEQGEPNRPIDFSNPEHFKMVRYLDELGVDTEAISTLHGLQAAYKMRKAFEKKDEIRNEGSEGERGTDQEG